MYLRREVTEADTLIMFLALGGSTPVCDFCRSDNPTYVYASRQMSTGEQRGCWRWMACTPCARAIDNYKWRILKARITAALSEMSPLPLTSEELNHAVEMSLLSFHENAIVVEPEGK